MKYVCSVVMRPAASPRATFNVWQFQTKTASPYSQMHLPAYNGTCLWCHDRKFVTGRGKTYVLILIARYIHWQIGRCWIITSTHKRNPTHHVSLVQLHFYFFHLYDFPKVCLNPLVTEDSNLTCTRCPSPQRYAWEMLYIAILNLTVLYIQLII